MLKKSYIYLLAVIFLCCEQPLDFDSDGGGSVNVSLTEFTTPSNTTVNIDSIRIEWEDNQTALIFDYKLEYVDVPEDWTDPHSWIEWDTTSATSVNFSNLDEGDYIFYIKGRFDLDNIGAEATLPFTVNAITDTALRIYPLNQTAQYGDEIDVYLYFEDVVQTSAVTGLHVDINIPSELEFITDSYDQGDLIKQFSGTTIFPTPTYSDGSISINGVADKDGSGLYGTGSIAKFRLRVMATDGTSNITIANASYKDINDNAIGFQNPVGGTVTVTGVGQ